MRILLADDDFDLTDVTEYALRREGHSVTLAHDGDQALARFFSEQPDVMLLDVGMAPVDGFEVCRRVREASNTPLIMISARDSEWAMARAFELGADDYITKPYSFRELIMRIGAVTRRARSAAPASALHAGPLRLDADTGEVAISGHSVRLTRIEFRLLQCLLANYPRVATVERLLSYAWPSDRGDVNVLKTHLSHVRHKLTSLPGGANIVIESVPGIGYRLLTERPGNDSADPHVVSDSLLTS